MKKVLFNHQPSECSDVESLKKKVEERIVPFRKLTVKKMDEPFCGHKRIKRSE